MRKSIKKFLSIITTVVLMITSYSMPTSYALNTDEATGTFQCDWCAESHMYAFEYADEWFTDSSYTYDHNIATFALELSMSSFTSFDENDPDKNIANLYEQADFEVKSLGYETEDYDTIGVSFGKKEISVGGETFTLVCAAIRSGNYGMEWGGNLNVGMGENHKGFEIGRDLAIGYINEYFKEEQITGRVKLLIPGYSRGASVANLTAAALDDGTYSNALTDTDYIAKQNIALSDIYTYTFEAPQCTKSDKIGNPEYKNIFNITNPSDYVTKYLLSKWGYSLYGVRYYLPSAETLANYDEYYDKLCTKFDSIMGVNGKKSSHVFYDAEHSRSMNALLDNLIDKLADSVFKNQEYYVENYETGLVFIAGQYLGQQLGGKDALKTAGAMFNAVAFCFLPKNISSIQINGFRSYLANEIFESGAGNGLTQKEIDGMLEVVESITDFIRNNKSDISALLGQFKTIIYVHQPYVELTWMKVISEDDILAVNKNDGKLKLLYNTLDIDCKSRAKVPAVFTENGGKIEWLSADKSIATVNENGVITAVGKGTSTITATLYDKNGNKIESASVTVTVK